MKPGGMCVCKIDLELRARLCSCHSKGGWARHAHCSVPRASRLGPRGSSLAPGQESKFRPRSAHLFPSLAGVCHRRQS